MNIYTKRMLIAVFSILLVSCAGSEPGQWANETLTNGSINALMDRASDNGAGHESFDAEAVVHESNGREYYSVNGRRTAGFSRCCKRPGNTSQPER